MARKVFISLMEENVLILDKMSDRLHKMPTEFAGHSRAQVAVLVRLYLRGRAMLKDIARHENVSAPNLCTVFRKLETDGLISRSVDENDRRNTWYSVTVSGAEIASQAMEVFRNGIENMFKNISRDDENALTESLKTINKIFKDMELVNA